MIPPSACRPCPQHDRPSLAARPETSAGSYTTHRDTTSAGRLYEIAKALGVTIQYFYESAPRLANSRRGGAEEPSEFVGPDTGEELELLGFFRRIPQPGPRKAVIDLAKKQCRPQPKPLAGAPKRKR